MSRLQHLLAALTGLVAASGTGLAETPRALVNEGLAALCDDAGIAGVRARFEPAAIAEEAIKRRDVAMGTRYRVDLAAAGSLILERLAPQARVRRLSVEWRDGTGAPGLLIIAGPDCRIAAARELVSDSDTGPELVYLDAALRRTKRREPLDPPVPAAPDKPGVTVALVDSGVNYLLPGIGPHLARDADGVSLGYDFWDLDPRPFDADPARSPFFPQRHGTRTASLVLHEASAARLLPYRYPRPDMSRMTALVEHAARHGARVVNLSLGSNRRESWLDFERTARAHPRLLFVVSAGNNGRDLDVEPVYPAAFELPNQLTVTSSDANGRPAPGSNWGAASVDLLAPGEDLTATGFDGAPRRVSGSSYAAARVSALAARLAAGMPGASGVELRKAVLDLAVAPPRALDAAAWLANPLADLVEVRSDVTWYNLVEPHGPVAGRFAPTLVVVRDSGWTLEDVLRASRRAAQILERCGVLLDALRVLELAVPDSLRDFSRTGAAALLAHPRVETPLAVFMRDTMDTPAFDAVSFGTGNSRRSPHLRFSSWLTAGTRDPGIALAHELAHVLLDDGAHTQLARNLLREDTSPDNTVLTDAQCVALQASAARNGLLGSIGN